MDDNTIEIHDDEINIEEITEKIREKIRIRQEAGEQRTDSEFNSTSDPKHVMDPSNDPIGRDLIYIKANWDIHNNNYFISSHRPYIGNFVVKGRQLIHGEVRRYVDPIISRQTEFNASSARSLAKLTQMISRQNEEVIADIQKCVNTKFDEVFSPN
jgi:hypothetical protein